MLASKRERLAGSRLYLVCEAGALRFLDEVLEAGVDIVQLRDRTVAEGALRQAADAFRELTARADVLLVINDDPDLAVAVDADGVHLGQEDMPVAQARAIVGPERLIGYSTHGPAQLDRARGVDYVAVGPVHATPTKPGRPAIGLAAIRYAAERSPVPFFAIGGIDAGNVDEVTRAGARRVVVVRAIADADDPAAATRCLAGALAGVEEVTRAGTT